MLTYYNPCIKIVFPYSSGIRMFCKTPVLHTLLDVHKTCDNERSINMRYSIYTFTMRLTYVKHALLDLHVYHGLKVR